MNRPLMQRLLDAGYPCEEMDHHYTDLYVFVTPLTTEVLNKRLEDNGWRRLQNDPFLVSRFRDQITGRMMYDVAFQYLPELEEAAKRGQG